METVTIEVAVHAKSWDYKEAMGIDYKVKGDSAKGFFADLEVEIDKEMFELYKDTNFCDTPMCHFDVEMKNGEFNVWLDDETNEMRDKEYELVACSKSYEECAKEMRATTIGFMESELEGFLEYYREKVEYAEEGEDIEHERELLARLEDYFKKVA
ncbi:MAG: hypothetical protein K2N12_07205 [Helicobacter sp.]|nr:hypothetical protein [Helicobacter sp.]